MTRGLYLSKRVTCCLDAETVLEGARANCCLDAETVLEGARANCSLDADMVAMVAVVTEVSAATEAVAVPAAAARLFILVG